MSTSKVVVLDRDGVINYDSPHYIKTPAEWRPIPGSLKAISDLHQAGWRTAVASNQAGIARGIITPANLDAIHTQMLKTVHMAGGLIDAIAFCPHGPDEGCTCRKPEPGLLLELAERLDFDITAAVFVGDKPSDVRAAQAAGAQPLLVRTGHGEKTANTPEFATIPVYDNLAAVAAALLGAKN